MEGDRFVLRAITDEIMYELMLLSGQEYVDEYATSMKDRLVRAAKARAREIQEAARPGSAAKEIEDALDAAEGLEERRESPVDDVAIGRGDDAVDDELLSDVPAPRPVGDERAAS